jgi:hypothetical protein
MLGLFIWFYHRRSPVMVMKKTDHWYSSFSTIPGWRTETYYYVRMLPWWKPWRWVTLMDSGKSEPAKFSKVRHARSAAHELQVGLRTLKNERIIEVHL